PQSELGEAGPKGNEGDPGRMRVGIGYLPSLPSSQKESGSISGLIICEDEFAYVENKPVSQFQTASGAKPIVDKIEGPTDEARPIVDEIEEPPPSIMPDAPEPNPVELIPTNYVVGFVRYLQGRGC